MEHEGHNIPKLEFVENMEKKIGDKDFTSDMNGLLRMEAMTLEKHINLSIKTFLTEFKT